MVRLQAGGNPFATGRLERSKSLPAASEPNIASDATLEELGTEP